MGSVKPTSNGSIVQANLPSSMGKYKLDHMIAGVSGGVVSSAFLHPLDLIKIRFAVNTGLSTVTPQYSGFVHACQAITKSEGLRGLWRGATPNIIGSGFSWGAYFMIYENGKVKLREHTLKQCPECVTNWLAATIAGGLTLVMANPIWVVKTRLCLQYVSDVHLDESKKYKGMTDAIQKIYRTEGFRGLYKGFAPGFIGVQHGAIQFAAYDALKIRYNEHKLRPREQKLVPLEYIACAVLSKFLAAFCTYPYQVVRARLQDHHQNYNGTWHCTKLTWRSEGFLGFYKGLVPYLFHVVPNIVVVFLIYEQFVSD